MSSANIDTSADMHQLYCQHHGWLQGLLRKRLGNLCDAAESGAGCLCTALAEATSVRQPRGCAGLSERDGARHVRRISGASGEIERVWLASLAEQPEPVALSAEDSNIILETLYQVDAMLCALPEKVRAAFIMAQVQGRPYRDIAEALGVSERMVKKYMAQAMLHCVLLEAEIDADGQATRS
nr:sigma factor-like helix-turn-helix DNA-binding protein [Pectobacterium colocasium]